MKATFFDLLGIDPNLVDRATAAAALWPDDIASLTQGLNQSDNSLAIVNMLQQGLEFTDIRPGVDARVALGTGLPGQIALAARMAVVGPFATSQPFYLRAIPDHGIQLALTDPLHPAQIFIALDGRGLEVIIDRLPVKIFLKEGLAAALDTNPVTVGTFDPVKPDSFAYQLGDATQPAQIECFIRLHLTPEGDVILEPSVPISFGPVRWMGLPATAVYDVLLLPSPHRREYLEWAHNDVGSFFSNPPADGAIGFRSIDVDFSQPPFSDLRSRLQGGAVHIDNLELVLEDVVVPVTVPLLPIPSHGTFGFRRKITDRTDIGQAYSLSGAPVQIPLYKSDAQGGNGGTSLTLQIEEFFFRTGDIHAFDPADQPQVQFQTELIFQTQSGNKLGPTMGIDDEWTFTAGMVMDLATTPVKMTIADTTIGFVGFKLGVSVGRMASGIGFGDSYEILGDFFVTSKPTGSDSSFFKMRSLTGKDLSLVVRDVGYKLGHLSLDGLQMPDGMQLIFANTIRIIIEEMGWVEESNGTPYFSFSGGVALGFGGGNAVKSTGNSADNEGNGFGIRVRRLRFRLNDDETQPRFKLDGLFLKLKYAAVDVEGFGFISDYTDSGWAIREWGFGAKIALHALAKDFSLACEFIKGHRQTLPDAPLQQFDYFLAAFDLSFLPAGAVGLYDIRAIVADNMAPNLDSTFPNGEGMALLKWHQTHDSALSLPANRSLSDWIAEDHAFSLGVGAGFSLNGAGALVHLNVFIFYSKSAADNGVLVVGDVLLMKNPKPIGFLAFEYDFDTEKFSAMLGINLTVADLASGNAPDWVKNLAPLTGNLYAGNQPYTFAIGQLADQTTWLNLQVNVDFWVTAKLFVGTCLQVVDGGPKGIGLVLTLSAGSNWGIGKFVVWGTFGFIVGTWKTGSDSMGAEVWVSLGFKINLFFVFNFGAEVGLKITYIGKHPWYITLHGEFKIDTPWFMPDVTFTVDKTYQESLPFDTSTITQSLSTASALDPTAQQAVSLLVPGLGGALGDAGFVYTFNQLNGLNGIRLGDTHARADIPVVSADSTIVINLAQPVSNDSSIATSTYQGTSESGVQTVQNITARYGLKSIAVRRSPRYGATAGVWTDFVTDAQTGFSIGGVAEETLTFAWDVDSRADGKLSPKRLLMNSAAPYSFVTQGAQSDEEAVRNDLDFPCCKGSDSKSFPRPHVLAFEGLPVGTRTPRTEQFTGPAGSTWVWSTPRPPTVTPGDPAYPGGRVAGIWPTLPRASFVVGSVDLERPAGIAQLEVTWDPLPGSLVLEAYSGLTVVSSQTVNLAVAGTTTVSVTLGSAIAAGISRLVLRFEAAPIATSGVAAGVTSVSPGAIALASTGNPALARFAIHRISYITLADLLAFLAGTIRCGNGGLVGPPGSDASGKLAFLPNHDYEVVVTSSIAVGTVDQGTRSLDLSEAFYFRTKGLPGLNACPNVGDDIRLHVAATYPPRRATLLYRSEPCVLAFDNSLSSVLPIDRAPGPGDAPEKAQMFPLELNIDRVASLSGFKRLTVPSNDWILAHRANPYTPIYWVADLNFAKSKVRRGPSSDPFVLRFEAVISAMPVCGTPSVDHASQVLLHEPIDATGTAGLWEPGTAYRATARQQNGPFAERTGFDIYDLGAFIMQADGGATATLWSVDSDGNLVAPAAGTAGSGRFYASCGELDWDHLQVHSRIDLAAANSAGLAVGTGDGTHVAQAVLATVEKDGDGHSFVMRVRRGGADTEIARSAVTLAGPFLLAVVAYDDVVRASVGDVSLDCPRGDVREGRVALLADGPATFAGIEVSALDIHAFEFVSSKYTSFAEHLGSYDGNLATIATGTMGGTPTPVATVLATHGAEIPPLMQASADPQERQKLFDAMVSELGIGQRKNPIAVAISRVTEAGRVVGLLVESPEPVSLTRDVVMVLSKIVRIWVPGHGPFWPPPTTATTAVMARSAGTSGVAGTPSAAGAHATMRTQAAAPGGRAAAGPHAAQGLAATTLAQLATTAMASAAAARISGGASGPQSSASAVGSASAASTVGKTVGASADLQTALVPTDFVFGAGRVMVPKAAATFAPCDEIALIVAGPEGTSIEIYSTPLTADGSFAYGILRQTISQDRARQQPAYAAVATLAAGTVAVLHAGGVLGPIWFGHWVDVPVAIPTSALTNGNETAVLILPQNGAPLSAAKYRLEFSLDRDRWSASMQADPEQHYSDEWVYDLSW
jgi:hypothetical protein